MNRKYYVSHEELVDSYSDELVKMARCNKRSVNSNPEPRIKLHFKRTIPRSVSSNLFSQKVFIGGAPPHMTDLDINEAFSKYGNFKVEKKKATDVNNFFYLIYESSACVKNLLNSCAKNTVGEYFTSLGSQTVQVIPWEINNSHFVPTNNQTLLDNKKVIFVGGLHGKMTAKFLADIFSGFGQIVMVTIDVDKFKYPIGSGRVAFADNDGYRRAIAEEFVDVQTPEFKKTIQITPQLEDSMCTFCQERAGPFFCKNFACYRYFCTLCWKIRHSEKGFDQHQPLMRNSKHKPKLGPSVQDQTLYTAHKTVMSQYICKFDDETAKKAEKELNETPTVRKESIENLRAKLKRNNLLVCPVEDDKYLLKFLRRSKFDVEKAEYLLTNYFRIKSEHPKFCSNILPSAIEIFLQQKVSCILPGRTEDGCAVYMLRPGNWNPDLTDLSYMYKLHILNLEWLLANYEEVQVHGIHVIADLEQVGWSQVRNFSKEYALLMTSLYQDAFPLRMKGFHFVAEPKVFSYLFAIIKPFLKSKFLSRIVTHGYNLESLHSHIRKEILPAHLEGFAGTWEDIYDNHVKILRENEQFYSEIGNYKLHQSTAVGNTGKSTEQVGDGRAGVSGTFQKLNVD
ncbi:DgyrCDS12005 [Dimorphilus gyrociliatus]|uniref:DgyrCDS12005 n=1 Tax=Dimorphilus gyrociliatus TaxID=2664684 RepID=A0A7I8W8F5_9ANNE|nr:DgyrCDS12005 [Dimorphilus gyrociliatus]